MKFNKLKIKQKFIFEVVVLSIIFSLASFFTISNALEVERNVFELNNDLIPRLNILKDMRLVVANLLISTLEVSVFDEKLPETEQKEVTDLQSAAISAIQNSETQFEQLFSIYKQHVSSSDNDNSVSRIEEKWEEFKIHSNRFVEYNNRGISGIEFIEMKDDFKLAKDNLFREIDLILLENEEKVNQKEQIVSNLVKSTTIILSVVVLMFVAIFVTMHYYVFKSILKPILRIRNVTKRISKGNLGIRITNITNDEIGELSQDINDMTYELEAKQNELLKNEKLSAVGALAARLAHDIRNPLAVIMTQIESIQDKYKNIEDKKFETINKSIQRISHQIQDVLDFVTTTELDIESVPILKLVRRIIKDLNLPKDVEITLPHNEITIECDYRKIAVIFINLIMNAADAINMHGKIQIRMLDIGESIKIEVEDSGKGIPHELADKIFEPLFTTKQKGTGLGLASCKNIIDQHGGTITFSNNPTTFTIILPKKQTKN